MPYTLRETGQAHLVPELNQLSNLVDVCQSLGITVNDLREAVNRKDAIRAPVVPLRCSEDDIERTKLEQEVERSFRTALQNYQGVDDAQRLAPCTPIAAIAGQIAAVVTEQLKLAHDDRAGLSWVLSGTVSGEVRRNNVVKDMASGKIDVTGNIRCNQIGHRWVGVVYHGSRRMAGVSLAERYQNLTRTDDVKTVVITDSEVVVAEIADFGLARKVGVGNSQGSPGPFKQRSSSAEGIRDPPPLAWAPDSFGLGPDDPRRDEGLHVRDSIGTADCGSTCAPRSGNVEFGLEHGISRPLMKQLESLANAIGRASTILRDTCALLRDEIGASYKHQGTGRLSAVGTVTCFASMIAPAAASSATDPIGMKLNTQF
eukprot:TRINITY_DN2721_c0_g1_i1.p1 TRINITY_DN2721_c0_g1~~TRINITY_DN2721_c0_g1_i1.p1  ORF type:complete len:372 (+),score=12.88 TRINITY_DN2721_c0_g1_i1:161-1276(+)